MSERVWDQDAADVIAWTFRMKRIIAYLCAYGVRDGTAAIIAWEIVQRNPL